MTKCLEKRKGCTSTGFLVLSKPEVSCLSQIFENFDKYYLRILEIEKILRLNSEAIYAQTQLLVILFTRVSSR